MSSLGIETGLRERDITLGEHKLFWHRRLATIGRFAGGDFAQTALLVVSILALLLFVTPTFRERQQRLPDPFWRPASRTYRSVVLELSIQIVSAGMVIVSFIESSQIQETSHWIAALLPAHVFLLGILRLILVEGPWRSLLLHHNNWLLTGMLGLSWTATLAPLVLIGDTLTSASFQLWKTGFISASASLAFVTPRPWCPPPVTHPLYDRLPSDGFSAEETCSYFSYYISYGWLSNTILASCKGELSLDKLPQIPWFDEPMIWLDRLLEARKTARNTFWLLLVILRNDIKRMMFFSLISALAEFVGPFAGLRLLQGFENPEDVVARPWIWIALLFLGPMSRSLASQQYLFTSTRLAIHLKLSLIQEHYKKLLRSSIFEFQTSQAAQTDSLRSRELLPLKSLTEHPNILKDPNTPQVINLISHDINSLASSCDLVIVLVAVPVSICFSTIFLYHLLGWPSLVGVGILTSSFPSTALLTSKMVQVQKKLMRAADAQIAVVSEYLGSIRTIKYFAWEISMSEKISEARAAEQRYRLRRHMYSVASLVSGDFIPMLALFGMLLVSMLVTDQKLTATITFTSFMITEILRQQFVWISKISRFVGQSTTALLRIDAYLETASEIRHHPIGPPMFRHAKIRRTPTAQFCLHDLSVKFKEGRLNIILGPSGCGKSTVLLSLLGHTALECGQVMCPKNVAYASQSPFIMNDTVRNNIIFYQTFEEMRYDAVLDACGLQKDLTELQLGDMTRVGENGSAISEGQKQRIALARAVYSKCSVVLLDDVFSSLDIATSIHIWRRCFRGGLLRDRTVILATQQDWLSKHAALLIIMDNGRFKNIFYPPELDLVPRGDYTHTSRLLDRINRRRQLIHAHTLRASPVSPKNVNLEVHLITQETAGTIWNYRMLMFYYLRLFGGEACTMSMLTAALAQIMLVFIPLWMSVWVGQYSSPGRTGAGFYLFIYGVALLFFLLFSTLSKVTFHCGAWKAASTIHEYFTMSILSVSAHWFDIIPVGRIINGFSEDMLSMDTLITESLQSTVDSTFQLILSIGSITSILPIFAMPAAVISIFGFIIGEMYMRTQLSVINLASASWSPILSHFRDTMSGLITITSRGMQEEFADLLSIQLRELARVEETQCNLNRWVGVRADAATALVSMIAGSIAVYKSTSVSPHLLGFSLTKVIGLSSTIIGLVRNSNELVVELNSFRRLRQYAHLDSEELAHNSRKEEPVGPPEDVLHPPAIEFRNFSARYTIDGPNVLKNVSFKVQPGERIGIVGRTGVGKSTIALSLLGSLPITSGSILINGVNIQDMALSSLRREVALVPQEPILFRGSLHDNIDPTGTIPALQVARSLEAIRVIPSGHRGLASSYPLRDNNSTDTMLAIRVAQRGTNFSFGQRQIISLVRAIARQPQIVVLDEATTSLDRITDAAIQNFMRDEFLGVTVLSITRQLETVMDYDRVIVMEDGAVIEMDTPSNLWKARGGFYDMIKRCTDAGVFTICFEKNYNGTANEHA